MERIILKNPEIIEEQDIIFNQNSNYQKQKKQEKKNPIFKRNKPKKWAFENKGEDKLSDSI